MSPIKSNEYIRESLPLGTNLNDYIITGKLAQGGFSITYTAEKFSGEDRAKVVIKENLPANIAYRDKQTLEIRPIQNEEQDMTESYNWALNRFIKEANHLRQFKHPNIVAIICAFKALNTAYYVMPHIVGESLENVNIRISPQSEKKMRSILLPLLDALHTMHTAHFLHRDVKPSNIIVSPDNTPVLLDFGAARNIDQTSVHTLLFSAGYTAPEMQEYPQTEGRVGPWSDLYGLGMTMYYLLTQENPEDRKPRHSSYVPLRERPDLMACFTVELLESIDKAIETDPTKRWQSAEEWKAYLLNPPFYVEEGAHVPEAAPIVPVIEEINLQTENSVLPEPPKELVEAAQLQETKKGNNRKSTGALVFVLLILLLMLAGCFVYLHTR